MFCVVPLLPCRLFVASVAASAVGALGFGVVCRCRRPFPSPLSSLSSCPSSPPLRVRPPSVFVIFGRRRP